LVDNFERQTVRFDGLQLGVLDDNTGTIFQGLTDAKMVQYGYDQILVIGWIEENQIKGLGR
jgi:hypothetical protein